MNTQNITTVTKYCFVMFLAAVVLTGCATQKYTKRMNENTSSYVDRQVERTTDMEMAGSAFSVVHKFHAAKTPITQAPAENRANLPAAFYRPIKIDIRSDISLVSLLSRLSASSGIRIDLAPDALDESADSSSDETDDEGAPKVAATADMPPPGSLPPLPTMRDETVQKSVEKTESNGLLFHGFYYNGTIKGLLNMLTAKSELHWKFTAPRVVIFKYATRVFHLAALAGQYSTSTTMSTQSSGGGAGGAGGGGAGGMGGSSGGGISGSSGQSISISRDMDIWGDVEEALDAILVSEGASYSMVPTAGIITVRATPVEMNIVAAQISSFNQSYSKSVMLKVDIYSVKENRSQNYGLNWDLFWKELGQHGVTISGGGAGAIASGMAITLKNYTGPFKNSGLFLKALSKMGQASNVVSTTAITLNGQTVPINIGEQVAYLKSYSTTLGGGVAGGTTTTLTPGMITEGLTLSFTPRILSNNEVIVRYSVGLSTINGIKTISPGEGTAIQLPQRSIKNFIQNVSLNSGESLMLASFQQATGSETVQGPVSGRSAWLLGGSTGADAGISTMIIIVTPYIMQD